MLGQSLFVWVVIWFLVGLGTFSINEARSTVDEISKMLTLLSFFLTIPIVGVNFPNLAEKVFSFLWVAFLSSWVNFSVYLMGANISRASRFGRFSENAFLTALLIFGFSVVLLSVSI